MNVDDFENNLGTTSAHAENTFETFTSVAQNRNYLRARGEYWRNALMRNATGGTTSAHAENTVS